jgi:hypothetical protein
VKSIEERVVEVNRWVHANQRVYSGISTIKLSDVSMAKSTLSGSALLTLDDRVPSEDVSIWLGGDGWLTYSLPMFHSPLGAPASFPAVLLTGAARPALDSAIRGLLPRVLPFGLHPVTKEWITQSTPLRQRLDDPVQFDTAFARISEPSFALVVDVR